MEVGRVEEEVERDEESEGERSNLRWLMFLESFVAGCLCLSAMGVHRDGGKAGGRCTNTQYPERRDEHWLSNGHHA